jgi:3,4-dihydroxy 2-butanone 4-phosphate synthase / GTP cyclohydrolase II
MKLSSITETLADLRAGRMIVMLDKEDSAVEGTIVLAANKATPEAINFISSHSCGQICVALPAERMEHLRIPRTGPFVPDASGTLRAFAASVDLREERTNGISAVNLSRTACALADPDLTAEHLVTPGHVFLLSAQKQGALRQSGVAEAAVELAKLAGLEQASVASKILTEKGEKAGLLEIEALALDHDLSVMSIDDLWAYQELKVRYVARARLPTAYGLFTALVYEETNSTIHHMALVIGDIDDGFPVLIRAHSECLTGDVFSSLRCDCGLQLAQALQYIAAEGRGILLYLRQEGRGIGLPNKLRAYALQEQGLDTVEANERLGFPADQRDYGVGAQILSQLGVRELRLLTNNPKKVAGFEACGLKVVERIPVIVPPTNENIIYLQTKREKMGHWLEPSPAIQDA